MKGFTVNFRVLSRVAFGWTLMVFSCGITLTFHSSNVEAASAQKSKKSAAKPGTKAADDDQTLESEFDSNTTIDLYKPELKKPHRPIAELRTLLAKDDKNNDVRIELAEALQDQKDYAGMVEVLRPAADHLPRRGMLLLAHAYGGQGDGLNEIRVLELVIAQNPKDYYSQTLTGEAYARAKKHDEAVERFSEAKKLNPQYELAYVDLLKEFKLANNATDTLSLLADMTKIFGEKTAYLDQLCEIYSNQAYIEKALETCPKAMEQDPGNVENRAFYAQALGEHDQPEQAQKVTEATARMFPQSEPAQWEAGSGAFERKDYLGSYRYFGQCVKADAKSSRCWLHLAKSAYELQKNQEAVDAFAKACNLNRSYTGEVRKAAAALRQKKDYVWPAKYEVVINRCSAITGSGD